MTERILVAEDEATLRTNIQRFLSKQGHEVIAVESGTEALTVLDERDVDLVLTDLRLPGADGLAVLDHARNARPEAVVLIMTAYASLATAVEALRRGAHDYLLKPLSLAALGTKIQHIAEYRALGRENQRLRRMLRDQGDPASLIRLESRGMQELAEIVAKVAPSSSNVLIQGESGTGKELVARAIHDLSERRDQPFVPVNVSAIPENLVESYLFGHERGAFTGADRRREGLFRTASGGTLFLDEIGELPIAVQAKVLRVLDGAGFERLGGGEHLRTDVRLVAATNRDLAAMAAGGTFRRDLLFRLEIFPIALPSLAERPSDVPLLARHLLAELAAKHRAKGPELEPEALDWLASAPWPGNVRQLANVLERAVILHPGERLAVAGIRALVEPAGGEDEAGRLRRALTASDGDKRRAGEALGWSYKMVLRKVREHDLEGFPRYRSGPPR